MGKELTLSQKVAKVEMALACRAAGGSWKHAAKLTGVKNTSIWRMVAQYEKGGIAALKSAKKGACGRKPAYVLNREELADLRRLVLQTQSKADARKVDLSLAFRLYAASDACSDELAEIIRKPRASKHNIPMALQRQVREAITAEVREIHRGEKTFALSGMSVPRGLFHILPSGAEAPILPGDIFERDDMTLNNPWFIDWEPGPDEKDPLVLKHGVKLLRGELLMQIDVGSQRGLSFDLIARPGESYRAEDIWAWVGRGYRDLGLPRHGERLERGIWEAGTINGHKVIDSTLDAPTRLGGLADLGVRRITSYTAKTKSIEAWFNQFQKCAGAFGLDVGRRRGEMERETKAWLRCRAGLQHPAEAGFLRFDDLAGRIQNAVAFLNQDKREGEVYRGVPDALWEEHVTAAAPLPALDPEKAWVFYPRKHEVTVRNGFVRCAIAEYRTAFYFHSPAFAALGTGYRVTVMFDPAMPDLGAAVFCRERDSRCRFGHRFGDMIGIAGHVDRVPQASALDGWDDRAGFERRRQYSAAVRKAYRSIPLPGRRGHSAVVARDHRGNEATLDTGAPVAAPARAALGAEAPRAGLADLPPSPRAHPADAARAPRRSLADLINAASDG